MDIQGNATLGEISRLSSEWLTVIEVAKELGVHPDTVRRWEKKGRIKCVRHPINNFRLFLLSDLLGEAGKLESKYSYLRMRVVERTRAGGVLDPSSKKVSE